MILTSVLGLKSPLNKCTGGREGCCMTGQRKTPCRWCVHATATASLPRSMRLRLGQESAVLRIVSNVTLKLELSEHTVLIKATFGLSGVKIDVLRS